MPLTDAACKAAQCQPGKLRERFADSRGLYLEARPNGSRTFWFKYRFGGVERRMSLGTYPGTTLAQARRLRDAARSTLDAGSDPVQARRDERAARALLAQTTFEQVARAWFGNWRLARSPRHADYVLRRLEADVFPVIGRKPVADVTAPLLLAMAKRIEARGAIDIARRAWQTCGQVFEFAVAHGLMERNPARDVRPGAALRPRKKEHYARIGAGELPALLRRIWAYQGSPYTRAAMQVMVMTFPRTGELIGARWSEVDFDRAEWRIPAERTKMRTPHIVPLPRQAVDVLRCLHEIRGLGDLLFPGERDHEKPMSNNTILAALKRMGYAGTMTGHGFRGVASTILHEQGFDHAHIELQLAHQERDDVSAAYNFATYLPQRRAMLQWYADHLDALRQGAKVIPLRAS